MAGNEPLRPSGVYSYEEARRLDKYMNLHVTTSNSYGWRDIRTGGAVYFNHY